MAKGVSNPTHFDLWDEAFRKLGESESGRKTLTRFQEEANGREIGALDTERGRRRLLKFINAESERMNTLKGSYVPFARVCHVMSKAKDLIATAASPSPPATIAVAGLFFAFDLYERYKVDSTAMFDTAAEAADIVVRAAAESDQVTPRIGDLEKLADLRRSLQRHYVTLYQTLLEVIAKLLDALHSNPLKKLAQIFSSSGDWTAHLATLQKADLTRRQDLEAIDRVPQPVAMNSAGRNALHEAAAAGRHDEVSQLLEGGKYDINAKTKAHGWTALMLACERGHLEVVKRLLDRKLDIEAQNDSGRRALHIATFGGYADIVRALLRRWPDPANAHAKDSNGRSAFLTAAEKGNLEIVRALSGHGALLDQLSYNGWTALHLAAREDKTETVQYLISEGARMDIKIAKGYKIGQTARDVARGESMKLFP